jgi:hypothetical protein
MLSRCLLEESFGRAITQSLAIAIATATATAIVIANPPKLLQPPLPGDFPKIYRMLWRGVGCINDSFDDFDHRF